MEQKSWTKFVQVGIWTLTSRLTAQHANYHAPHNVYGRTIQWSFFDGQVFAEDFTQNRLIFFRLIKLLQNRVRNYNRPLIERQEQNVGSLCFQLGRIHEFIEIVLF